MEAIEDGMYQPVMKARMIELMQQKAEIEARLSEAPADLPDVHPNIAEHYRAKVIRLAETLAEPGSDGEARQDIRSLIGEVVITPGDKRGETHAILRGELMAILDCVAGRPRSPKPGVITNALAGPRNQIECRSFSTKIKKPLIRAAFCPPQPKPWAGSAAELARTSGIFILCTCCSLRDVAAVCPGLRAGGSRARHQ
ncbi:hypothetical protein [Bradyrhizobium sp.]|uniref:hypothetical protein n=1 Tax=Bradyrhizobium sp. TaxID=376 RepID=UPI0025C1481E|nr:hypothetical protein [Bradyrhizobium sp.]